MRAVWLVLVLVLAGCTVEVAGTPVQGGAPAAGPVDLAVPVELRPVLGSSPPGSTPPSAPASGTTLPDPSGERLTLDAPYLVIERLDGAEVSNADGNWVLVLDLDDEDAAAFADWTADHVGERLAIVVDGEVVVAPEIQSAITGGEVRISGPDYTRDDVEELLATITGR